MSRQRRKLSAEFPLQITTRINNREFFPVSMPVVWEIFGDYLYLINKIYDIKILQFVLMGNHYHMICRDPNLRLSKALRFLNRETSREISRLSGRVNHLWGRTFHSSIISTQTYFFHAYKYNYRNPVVAGLCGSPENYPWSTLQILLGFKHGIIPIEEDMTLFEDVEGTLKWLGQPYASEEAEALRRGFRKKIFQLGRDPRTQRQHALELEDSVPIFTRRVAKR